MRLISLVSCLALIGAVPAHAAGFISPDEVDAAVMQFTGAPIGADGGARLPVDRRLKLSMCDQPLALEWYGRNRDSVLVRCPVAGGWRLFVPVQMAPGAGMEESAVTRGDSVAIVIEGNGFTLSRQGEAMEGGPVGAWIRVRPAGTKAEPLRARIIEPGKVGMNLP